MMGLPKGSWRRAVEGVVHNSTPFNKCNIPIYEQPTVNELYSFRLGKTQEDDIHRQYSSTASQGLDDTLSMSRDQLQNKARDQRRMKMSKTVAVDLHSYNRIIKLE